MDCNGFVAYGITYDIETKILSRHRMTLQQLNPTQHWKKNCNCNRFLLGFQGRTAPIITSQQQIPPRAFCCKVSCFSLLQKFPPKKNKTVCDNFVPHGRVGALLHGFLILRQGSSLSPKPDAKSRNFPPSGSSGCSTLVCVAALGR